jgi:Fe-S-cluster containining protein
MSQDSFFERNHNQIIAQAEAFVPTFKEVYQMQGGDGLVKLVHHLADKILDKSGLFNGHATCSKACSFCCHDTIMMTRLETEYIKKKVNLIKLSSSQQERKELQQKIPNIKTNPRANQSIKFMDRACPMLSDENENGERLCTIYEHRPLVCRGHNSMEAVEFCNKEEYPDRFIGEGRIVEFEALTFGLMLLEKDLKIEGKFPHMGMMQDL